MRVLEDYKGPQGSVDNPIYVSTFEPGVDEELLRQGMHESADKIGDHLEHAIERATDRIIETLEQLFGEK